MDDPYVIYTPALIGRSSGCSLTFGAPTRKLPRIRTRKTPRGYWRAEWVAQNNSTLYCEERTRVAAVKAVIGYARYQRWPLLMRAVS